MHRIGLGIALTLALGAAPQAWAQDDAPTNEELLERLRKLEAEVERLRAQEGAPAEPAPAAPDQDFRFDPDFTPEPAAGGGFRFDPEQAAKAKAMHGGSWKEEDEDWLSLELPFSTKLTVAGQVRARGEYRAPADFRIPGTFGRPATDDKGDATDFALLRTRISLSFDVVDHLQAHVELQDSRRWGDRITETDVAEVHLRQGYLTYYKAFGQDLTFKLGRWAVPNLGEERVIGDPDFNNVGRAWDGLLVEWGPTRCLDVTAFAANLREGAVFSADGDENDDFWISGVYASWAPIAAHRFEAYLIWRHFSDRVFTAEQSARLGDRKDFTLGGRIAGERCGWDYMGEIMFQWGDQAGDRVRAFAGAARLGFTQPLGKKRSLGAHLEYGFASGDRNPTDGKLQTFSPIAPKRFKHHGIMNLVGFSNMHDLELGFTGVPFERLKLHLEAHAFWLDKRKDAWFDAQPSIVRRDPSGASRSFLGSEVDVYAEYELFERLSFLGGYGHFFPGQYVRDSSAQHQGVATQDQGWLFAQVQLNF